MPRLSHLTADCDYGASLNSPEASYYRARYYDPQAGRFISEDPTGFQAGVDFYSYAFNRPVLLNDPTGLDNRTGRCKALSDAIKNLDKDIADAERDLATNPNNLPESCPGDIDNPAASQSGHRRILRNLKTDRLLALVEYIIRNCGDIPPIPPIPVTAPNTNPAPGQTSTAVTIVISILVGLGLAAAL